MLLSLPPGKNEPRIAVIIAASHLILFCSATEMPESRSERYAEMKLGTNVDESGA